MWYSYAIASTDFASPDWGDSLALGGGLRLERIPDWVKQDDALKLLSWNERENVRDADWALVAEYEADALGSPDPEWRGKTVRSIQDSIYERFALMELSLWMALPSNLGITSVLHFSRPGDPTSMRHYISHKPIMIRDDEIGNIPRLVDFAEASRLYEVIMALNRDCTCWIATWFLIRAVTEELWQARYLWQWIVLEALYGPNSAAETTFQLAQRIALFTESDSALQRQQFKAIKEAYSWRSKLVHGGRTRSLTADKSKFLTIVVEDAIRRSLNRILSSDELVRLFDGKLRDAYLEDLAFGR